MNRALLYLWFALLKRRVLDFVRSLRRPTTLIGFAYVLGLLGVLFWFRHHEIFGRLVQRNFLMTGAFLMLGGSLVKGFWQRGLVFEPPDIEFVFTSPFTQRQVVCYRLLPNYLYALLQGLVLAALFAPHLSHPVLMAAGLTFFQITCFHVSTVASLYAGTFPEDRHHRLRCMLLGAGFLFTALYFRAAWEVRFVPAFALSPVAQLVFYPAVTLPEAASSPAFHNWALRLTPTGSLWLQQLWSAVFYLGATTLAAGVSLWGLFRLKANLFEPSLATTSRAAERRLFLRQGRDLATAGRTEADSAGLPSLSLFGGVGAIVWKNLLAARRSRRQLLLAIILTALNAGSLVVLLQHIHTDSPRRFPRPAHFSRGDDGTVYFPSRARFLDSDPRPILPTHLPLRLSPRWPPPARLSHAAVSPCAWSWRRCRCLSACVVLCQAAGLVPLLIYARFDWPILLLLILAYPAIALALNSVWNLHYLLSATKRAAGNAQSPSAVGTLMVVVLSFLVFIPAVWTTRFLAKSPQRKG